MCRIGIASVAATLAAVLLTGGAATSQESKKPVKVFILAGQSNMEGQGAVKTLDWLGQDKKFGHLLDKIKNKDGTWVTRKDVWVYYPRARGGLKKGELTVGFGVRDDTIGPELLFGQVMGDHFDNQVLLIKTAWGGRALATDFRPPSSGGETGATYKEMLAIVREALGNLDKHFPDYQGRGYELAGFVWFQGWNDMINADRVAEYEKNLVNLIKDVRKDLKAPGLPFVIGELGVGGKASAAKNERMADIRKAQAAPALMAEFKGTVASVPTWEYWDEEADALVQKYWIKRKWTDKEAQDRFAKMGNQPQYHYLGSGKIFALVGYGFGEAMKELLTAK